MDGQHIFLIVLSAIIVFLLIVVLIFSYVIFNKVSRRKKPRKPGVRSIFSQNKIDIIGEENMERKLEWIEQSVTGEAYIKSYDGLTLHCSLIEVKEKPKGVIIVFHGYRSFGARDFCNQLPILHEAGYNIMLVDQRSHGKSEGKYICYGTKEHIDALLWRKKASEIYGNDIPIALFGLSMGGATVLMASGDIKKEDTQVKCVVADCPFYSAYEIITYVLWANYKIYPQPIIHFVRLWALVLARFNMKAPSCAEKAKKSSLPFLLFHGKEDKFVPTNCSIRLAEEIGESARLVLVDEARHAESIYYNKELYVRELLEFLEKYMH